MWKLVGADPELFLAREKRIVSAIGKLGGTKDHPIPVKELGKGFAFQEDNVLVEYNIPPAARCGDFVDFNRRMIDYLTDKVKMIHPDYYLLKDGSGCITEEDASDPRAHVFGCDPDFNAWTLEINPKPFNPNPLFRTAGGHLHFAIKCNNAMAIRFVRGLDTYVGLWSVINDPDKERRSLYGKAGAMRRKPYGVEYRVLSNFWVDSVEAMQNIWKLAGLAWQAAEQSHSVIDMYGKDAVQIINASDVSGAKALLGKIY